MTELLQYPLANFCFLILGFLALVKGADLLVAGAGSIAKRWGVPSIVIGLTIVAFGTSAPEFFVNVVSSLNGTNGITIGNIIGSNLANILLGIGIIAIIKPIRIGKNTVWKEIPFVILATFLFWVAASDHILDDATTSFISRSEALMLLGLFIIFMVYTFVISKVSDGEHQDIEVFSITKSCGLFLLGLIGLTIGGEIVVSSATIIARNFGLSETLIGITIVAVGTSIPDIVTTIVAARKQNMGIAVGNILGSNIFNILWVLAASALIRPIEVAPGIQFDLLFTLGVAIALFLAFQFTGMKRGKSKNNNEIARWEGMVFVAAYIGYMVFLVVRG